MFFSFKDLKKTKKSSLCLRSFFRVPPPTLSHLGFIGDVVGDAIAVSFVAFATSYAMAKILAEKDKEEVNANQVNLSKTTLKN